MVVTQRMAVNKLQQFESYDLMRTLLILLTFAFASQSTATEIIMACDSYTFKYTKRIWSGAKIQYRIDSTSWKNYCSSKDNHLYVSGLKVTCDTRHILPDNPFFGLETVDFNEGRFRIEPNTTALSKQYYRCSFLKK